MGRAWRIKISPSVVPFSSDATMSGVSWIPLFAGIARPLIFRPSPSKKYAIRFAPADPAGISNFAPGASLSVQIWRSFSERAAHDFGGGEGAVTVPNLPAMTVTSVDLPFESTTAVRGIA